MTLYKYLYGPVPSRRLGRSLGVDLCPFKTCSLNCIFCQLGSTKEQTILRKEYVPTHQVLSELADWIKHDNQADFITLSGSGEPTLHLYFGHLLEFIYDKSNISSALLTNGTMLYIPEVREAAINADLVKVSLSAWDEISYQKINRPHSDLSFKQLITGQREFRELFAGKLYIEVFVLAGFNDQEEQIIKIAHLVDSLKPDLVQLNTAIRPPAETYAKPVSSDKLYQLQKLFSSSTEIISQYTTYKQEEPKVDEQSILAMLKRRPCTASDIANAFNLNINEVIKYITSYINSGKIKKLKKEQNIYYFAEHE